jgi:hypothetical protein
MHELGAAPHPPPPSSTPCAAAATSERVTHLAFKHDIAFARDYAAAGPSRPRRDRNARPPAQRVRKPLVIASEILGVVGLKPGVLATERDGVAPRTKDGESPLSRAQIGSVTLTARSRVPTKAFDRGRAIATCDPRNGDNATHLDIPAVSVTQTRAPNYVGWLGPLLSVRRTGQRRAHRPHPRKVRHRPSGRGRCGGEVPAQKPNAVKSCGRRTAGGWKRDP